ncbi:EAL domain-containing protein [Aliikangiella maris]|uniref:EAL domain-containing protein n=2 Tax=Aliikangiella maris TaxID=3162458 RepID=A0ABV2BV84_9GAMM
MIKSQLKQLILLLLIIVSIFIWVISSVLLTEFKHTEVSSEASKAAVISRLNLLIINAQIAERQGLGWFLQQLDNENKVVFWQLFDAKNQLVSQKLSGIPTHSTQSLYLYADKEQQELLTLNIYFPQLDLGDLFWRVENFIIIFTFIGSILVCLYLLFKWVFQLERFALYLLADSNNLSRSKFEKITNPVVRVINQLILKNTLLNKDKVELTDQIRKISYVDEVTELGNQMFFKAEFQVRLHNREENESGLFMLVSFQESSDPDNIILTADRLKEVANLLKSYSKTISHSLVARLKGNDFAVLLPNQSKENTDKICKNLIAQLDKIIFDATPLKEHFVDIGISTYKQGFDYYKVLAEADMALRNSQLQGGNSWYIYGQPLSKNQVRGHLRWRNFLTHVLEKRELQLFCQPIQLVDSSNEVLEVLVRIEDGKELLTADTFLPMAHDCGLAIDFDRQVVDGVIKHCLYSEQVNPQMIYSINLFISSLLDDSFVNWLMRKLSSYPHLSKRMIFEIKESQINPNLHQLKTAMNLLAQLGVGWCIENFGSPDEDLGFCEMLPIRAVKVDRRIIFDIHKDKPQQLFLQSLMINLKSRNIKIYAEGVEKEKDAEYLSRAGIDGMQGFYFGQPQRMKSIEKHLKVV